MRGQRDVALFEHLVGVDVENFAAVLSAAGVGVWEYDGAADRLSYNDQLGSMLGLPSGGTVTGREALAMSAPDDPIVTTVARLVRQATEGRTFDIEHRVRGADGRWIRCVSTISPILDPDGRLVRLVGIIRSQDELERFRHRMRDAELMAKLGHWSVDIAAGTMYWSDGVYHIYGYEPGEISPTVEFVRSRYVEPRLDQLDAIVTAALKGTGRFQYRGWIARDDGADRHVNVIGEVEYDSEGTAVSYNGIVQDVTDEVQREKQVRQAQKMEAIGNLTGGAAHDFNNTLAVILGNIEAVRAELDRTDLVHHCDAAIAAAMSGADVTRAMLSFARRAPLNPTTIDLNHLVRSVATWFARMLPATIETKMVLSEALWAIDVDAASMENALLNLVLNSRDAMPGGGVITVETANVDFGRGDQRGRPDGIDPGRYVMLAVGDTGHGVPQRVVERIFEPFFTTRKEGEGTGLGLSMVQGFVRQSHGAIQVDSTPGAGATMRLFFPAASGVAVSTTSDPAVAEDAATRPGGRLLVVEDDEHVLAILVEMLTRSGYEVHAARSGEEALDVFENGPWFDLVLTDVVMKGGLSGLQLVEQLRRHCPDIGVVYLSGYADWAESPPDAVRPTDLRLTKPVRMADLVRAIESSLPDPIS